MDRLPLSALLSQAFVAFAIEFDNEFEDRVPHRTTRYGATPGNEQAPWLVSMALWLRFMRHVPIDGIAVAELQDTLAISRKGLKTWLVRLGKWWGYLRIDEHEAIDGWDEIGSQTTIRPTAGGRRAIEVWESLIPIVETRWRERFGTSAIDALENSVKVLAPRLDPAVPGHFPILEYEDRASRAARLRHPPRDCQLPELLIKVLLAFAADFETRSAASLAVCANLLRVTPDSGIAVRDLPRSACLPKDGVVDALRQLGRERLGTVRTDVDGSRWKVLTLNAAGCFARDEYWLSTARVEDEWRDRFGDAVPLLRRALEVMARRRDDGSFPLLDGVKPYPDGWRARQPAPGGLPHFPIPSHRGAFPDGS